MIKVYNTSELKEKDIGFVYIARPENEPTWIKVGVTHNISQRIESLRKSSGKHFIIEEIIPTNKPYDLERKLKKTLYPFKKNGEFYNRHYNDVVGELDKLIKHQSAMPKTPTTPQSTHSPAKINFTASVKQVLIENGPLTASSISKMLPHINKLRIYRCLSSCVINGTIVKVGKEKKRVIYAIKHDEPKTIKLLGEYKQGDTSVYTFSSENKHHKVIQANTYDEATNIYKTYLRGI